MPQAERLGHSYKRVVDRLVAMGVIGLHDLADNRRALDVAAVGRRVQVGIHGVQDTPLHGLEPVAHVGQRPRRDHAERIIQISRSSRFGQRDILDPRVTPRPAFLSLARPAVPFRHRSVSVLDP